MTAYLLILALGLVAGCVGGVIGTGSSIILLPVLVYTFGPKQAVPIMANFFRYLLDAVMLVSGLALIRTAIHR